MTCKIARLVDAGSGAYALEWRQFHTLAEASERASVWWAQESTQSVVVFDGQREDARYERIADEKRIPDKWPATGKLRPGPRMPDVPFQPPKADVPAPTLFDATESKPAPATAIGACPCCLRPIPASGGYEGDCDHTPSGRLNEMRCPRCGAPWPHVGARTRDVLQRYLSTLDSGVDARSYIRNPW